MIQWLFLQGYGKYLVGLCCCQRYSLPSCPELWLYKDARDRSSPWCRCQFVSTFWTHVSRRIRKYFVTRIRWTVRPKSYVTVNFLQSSVFIGPPPVFSSNNRFLLDTWILWESSKILRLCPFISVETSFSLGNQYKT